MEYCSKIHIFNDLKNRIQIWLEYKSNKKRSNKWIIKYVPVDDLNSICYMIYSTDNYSNSGNVSKSICSFVFGSKQKNSTPDGFNYLVETFQLSSELDFYKKFMKFFITPPLPYIFNPNIFDDIIFFKYSKKRIYDMLKSQQHLNNIKNGINDTINNDNDGINNDINKDKDINKDIKDKEKDINLDNDDINNMNNMNNMIENTNSLQCSYCSKIFTRLSSTKRHEKNCNNNCNRTIIKIKDLEIKELKNELEKTKQLLDSKKFHSGALKTVENTKTTTNVVNGNITNITNNITNITNNIIINNLSKLDKLNLFFNDTIDFDTFLDKYQNDPKYKLTFEETKILLENSEMNGYKSFINDLSYYLKKKYKLQLEDFSDNKECSNDVSVLPFINYDINYRTHYEKFLKEWKVCSMDDKMKKLISISNSHIYEHHNKLVLLCTRENKSVVNGLLKNSSYEIVDNYLSKLQDCLENTLENSLENSLENKLKDKLQKYLENNAELENNKQDIKAIEDIKPIEDNKSITVNEPTKPEVKNKKKK